MDRCRFLASLDSKSLQINSSLLSTPRTKVEEKDCPKMSVTSSQGLERLGTMAPTGHMALDKGNLNPLDLKFYPGTEKLVAGVKR